MPKDTKEITEIPSPKPDDDEGIKNPGRRAFLKRAAGIAVAGALGGGIVGGTLEGIEKITSSESIKPTLIGEFDSVFKELNHNKFPVFENPNQTYHKVFFTEGGLYEMYISGDGQRQLVIQGSKLWTYEISQNYVRRTIITAYEKPAGLEFDEKRSVLTEQEVDELKKQLHNAFKERVDFEDLLE